MAVHDSSSAVVGRHQGSVNCRKISRRKRRKNSSRSDRRAPCRRDSPHQLQRQPHCGPKCFTQTLNRILKIPSNPIPISRGIFVQLMSLLCTNSPYSDRAQEQTLPILDRAMNGSREKWNEYRCMATNYLRTVILAEKFFAEFEALVGHDVALDIWKDMVDLFPDSKVMPGYPSRLQIIDFLTYSEPRCFGFIMIAGPAPMNSPCWNRPRRQRKRRSRLVPASLSSRRTPRAVV